MVWWKGTLSGHLFLRRFLVKCCYYYCYTRKEWVQKCDILKVFHLKPIFPVYRPPGWQLRFSRYVIVPDMQIVKESYVSLSCGLTEQGNNTFTQIQTMSLMYGYFQRILNQRVDLKINCSQLLLVITEPTGVWKAGQCIYEFLFEDHAKTWFHAIC